jgi:hypothetical protein
MDDALREIVEGLRAQKSVFAWDLATGAADDLNHHRSRAVPGTCDRCASDGGQIPTNAPSGILSDSLIFWGRNRLQP